MLQWLIFVSATLGTGLQGRRQVQGWLYDQRDRMQTRRAQTAGWSRGGVDTWAGTLAGPGAAQPAATVTVTVCDQHGRPDPGQAARLRRYLEEHEYLSRNPTPAEMEALNQAREAGGGLGGLPAALDWESPGSARPARRPGARRRAGRSA